MGAVVMARTPRKEDAVRYRHDASNDQATIDAAAAHVRAHLSSVADGNDDPHVYADEVEVQVAAHVDGDTGLVSVIGELDREPDAPYLRAGYDPNAEPTFAAPGDTPPSAWEADR